MNLIVCGILTTLAVLYCVVADETLGFNMLMCVLCVVALVSLWTGDNSDSSKQEQGDKNAAETEASEEKKQS